MSEPQTSSGRLFQSLGAKCEKALPPLVVFAIQGITKSPEFCDLKGIVHPKMKNLFQTRKTFIHLLNTN